MQIAPLPKDEQHRLNALHKYDVLDTESERRFDELTELVAEICQMPIALISLVDSDRQWFKSKVGLDACETSRDVAFCAHAILQDEVFEVPDATQDDRFMDNPLVTGPPNIRAYAGMPLVNSDGYKLGTLCVISDVPKCLSPWQRKALSTLGHQVVMQLELRSKIKTVEKISQAKGDFLSNMSHELRTPLNAIIGFSSVLSEAAIKETLPEQFQQHISDIQFSANQLISVINSVLDIEKIEAGKMELQLESVNLTALLESTAAMFANSCNAKNLTMHCDLKEINNSVYDCDKTKFVQIVTNLISNAVKFSKTGGCVLVKASKTKDGVTITIKDDGIGISDEEQKLLFNKFQQVGSKKNGTGLGLCITKQLVELMNGSILISSQIGKGTEFTIVLPLHESTIKEAIESRVNTTVLYANVAVVEDNHLNQKLIAIILDKAGCKYEIYQSAEQFESDGLACNHDIIFMDMNLPGKSGREITENLKEQLKNIPIIAVTADIFIQNDRALFDDVIQKPYSIEQIMTALCTRYK